MISDDENIARLLGAEVKWADAVHGFHESSAALSGALAEALSGSDADAEADAELAKIEELLLATLERLRAVVLKELDAVGDDAQLANVDLQNVLQKQQQTLQMMSNISKLLYDTAQAVIRKFGG